MRQLNHDIRVWFSNYTPVFYIDVSTAFVSCSRFWISLYTRRSGIWYKIFSGIWIIFALPPSFNRHKVLMFSGHLSDNAIRRNFSMTACLLMFLYSWVCVYVRVCVHDHGTPRFVEERRLISESLVHKIDHTVYILYRHAHKPHMIIVERSSEVIKHTIVAK